MAWADALSPYLHSPSGSSWPSDTHVVDGDAQGGSDVCAHLLAIRGHLGFLGMTTESMSSIRIALFPRERAHVLEQLDGVRILVRRIGIGKELCRYHRRASPRRSHP